MKCRITTYERTKKGEVKLKKTFLLCATAIIIGSLLTGCSLVSKANGLIVYGDESEITEVLEQEKDELINENRYEIKVVEDQEERMMVLSEETAQAVADKELLRKVTKGRKSEAMLSAPKLSKGEAVIYAKNEQEKLNLDSMNLQITYSGNSIIGDGRAFVDKFLVVDDSDWPQIEGEVKSMAIMEYEKDPSTKFTDFDVDDTQLVKIVD